MPSLSYMVASAVLIVSGCAIAAVVFSAIGGVAKDVEHGVPAVTGRVGLWRWLVANRQVWFLRAPDAREFSTRLYCGLPGSGKTLLMVRDAIQLMRQGVRVAANFAPVRDPYYGYEAEVCGSWLDMLRITVDALERDEQIIFLFDELHNVCDARSWANTPSWWLNLVSQRRHYGVGIMGSTQVPEQVEKRLRTLVSSIIDVHFVFPKWTRLPIVVERWLDARLIDREGEDAATSSVAWAWVPWYAYAGYSTAQVVASDDFAAYTDEAAAAEIAALTERMQELVRCERIPAFVDELRVEACALP